MHVDNPGTAGHYHYGEEESETHVMAKEKAFKFKWKLFAVGLASIIFGYVLLATNDITFAPILLVLGYCVLVPLSFL